MLTWKVSAPKLTSVWLTTLLYPDQLEKMMMVRTLSHCSVRVVLKNIPLCPFQCNMWLPFTKRDAKECTSVDRDHKTYADKNVPLCGSSHMATDPN